MFNVKVDIKTLYFGNIQMKFRKHLDIKKEVLLAFCKVNIYEVEVFNIICMFTSRL